MEFQGASWRDDGVEVALLPACGYSTREPTERTSLGFSYQRKRGAHCFSSDKLTDFDRLPGSYAITPGGTEMLSESDDGGEYLVIRYAPDMVDLPRSLSDQVVRGADHRLWPIARDLRSRLLRPDEDSEVMFELCLSALAAAIPASRADRLEDRDLVGRGLDIIDQRLQDEGFRVSRVARTLGTTPVGFLRAFHRVTGLTPSAFIRERRVQLARSMMRRRPTFSLSETAIACGFAHQSHMGTAFRCVIGVTPGQYLERMQ